MLKIGFADSDSANVLKTLEDNPVDAQIVNERGMLSHELPEAEVAEILAILTDNPAEASVEAFGLRKVDIQSTKVGHQTLRGSGSTRPAVPTEVETQLRYTGIYRETKQSKDFSLVNSYYPRPEVSGLDIFLYLAGALLSLLHSQSIGTVLST